MASRLWPRLALLTFIGVGVGLVVAHGPVPSAAVIASSSSEIWANGRPRSFRQRLARARHDLHSFMHDKCGLVNRANPCRCARKTRGFIDAGYVDPERLLFAGARVQQVRAIARAKASALTALDSECADVFRAHPFYEPSDLVPVLRQFLQGPAFRATDLP